MAKIPKKVSERFIKEIRSFQRVLKKAKDRDVNESDTVTIITDILSDVLGFDKYTEVTSEQAIRGTYCDLAVKMDGKIRYLIEVKAIGMNLKENHLRQAVSYGANQGIPWIVLTNGMDWEIYKIKFERPISTELVCSFNFTELNPRKQEDHDKVFLLCREGITTAAIEEFHSHVQSVNRFMIGAIVITEPILNAIRKELRRTASGLKVTNDEIQSILISEVFKRDLIEGEPFEKAKKQLKKIVKISQPKRKSVKHEKNTDLVNSSEAK
jgi:predicted type IV restriction endonuclease